MPGGARTRELELGGRSYRVEVLDLPAANKGHDAVLVVSGFVGVADGATPLEGPRSRTAADDVDPGRYARAALEELRALPDWWARAMFAGAIARLRDRFPARAGAPLWARPSCTVAVVRPMGDAIETAVLGDCVVIARSAGKTRTVSDARLRRVDARAIRALRIRLRTGVAPGDAQTRIRPLLRRHRSSMNRPGSYWAIAGDPVAGSAIRVGRFAQPPEVILLATDGFMRLVDVFREFSSRTALLDRALDVGLDELGRRLRLLESAPGSLWRYPRFSFEDDATAVLLRLTTPG